MILPGTQGLSFLGVARRSPGDDFRVATTYFQAFHMLRWRIAHAGIIRALASPLSDK